MRAWPFVSLSVWSDCDNVTVGGELRQVDNVRCDTLICSDGVLLRHTSAAENRRTAVSVVRAPSDLTSGDATPPPSFKWGVMTGSTVMVRFAPWVLTAVLLSDICSSTLEKRFWDRSGPFEGVYLCRCGELQEASVGASGCPNPP